MTRPALWLLGHGIAASPSPAMQNAALRACGLDWEYAAVDVSADALPAAVQRMRDGAARGANVTIPHKRAVAALCDELAGDAALTGAVNTVVVTETRLVGDNTDARGLEAALRSDGLWPKPGASVVVLGAGGAAAAAVLALSRAEPARITVVSRRQMPAEKVYSGVTHSAPWQSASVTSAEPTVLINATPAGLPELPVDVTKLGSTCVVVDLRYRYGADDLVSTARARGLRAADGLGMLLHQGMLSFQLWTGLDPPMDAARQALHAAIAVP